jgi:hypothetical protein
MSEDSSVGNISSPNAERAANGNGSGIAVGDKRAVNEINAADEDELSKVAKQFLIAEINRLLVENQQLKQFKDKYHDADKKFAVLKETLRPFRINDLLSSACLIAGSAGLGAAPSFLSLSTYGWYVFVSISTLLVIAAIGARLSGPSAGPMRPLSTNSK